MEELRRLAAAGISAVGAAEGNDGDEGAICAVELPAGGAELRASFRVLDGAAMDWEGVRWMHEVEESNRRDGRARSGSSESAPVREPELGIPLVECVGSRDSNHRSSLMRSLRGCVRMVCWLSADRRPVRPLAPVACGSRAVSQQTTHRTRHTG